MKQYLIADSGGTKTDWCLVDSFNNKKFFSTESYHPVNWNDDFFKRIRLFWEEFEGKENTSIYFFGAGCLEPEKCQQLANLFNLLGFKSIKIQSDLHAAAYSSRAQKKGSVAILGTGSVLFEWRNERILNVIGGKGHRVGDEGSGYYFGKLILKAFHDKLLNLKQIEILEKYKLTEIDLSQKFQVSNISKQLRNEKNIFRQFHELNIQRFITAHYLHNSSIELTIIGSYGFHHQDIIKGAFEDEKVLILKFIEKPIFSLVENSGCFID